MQEAEKRSCVTRLVCARRSKNSEKKSTELLCDQSGIIEIDHIESRENKSVAFKFLAEIGADGLLDTCPAIYQGTGWKV